MFFCVNSGSSEAFPIDLPLPVSDDTMIVQPRPEENMPPAAETEGKMKYENLVFDLY